MECRALSFNRNLQQQKSKKMTHSYQISGMHCGSCVAKIQSALESDARVKDAKVDLEKQTAEVEMIKHVPTRELREKVAAAGDYQMGEMLLETAPAAEIPEATLQTYRPLILIVSFIAGVSFLAQFPFGEFSWMMWMRHFMAGFFIVFSFFKLLNIKGFAESYAMYDIIAARWRGWGFVYPFVELLLGIFYLINFEPVPTNWLTIIVLGISSIGVIQSNLSKRKIKCACLGDVFNLPMSTVTIIEDVGMVAMAAVMLVVAY